MTDHRPSIRTTSRRRPLAGATLESVARLAGVAPTTVSRAINSPEKVSRATLERITKAIADTGYVPNLLAGGLASSRSRLIAAIVPSIANPVYAETVRSFTERMRESGYQVILGEAGYTQETEEALVAAVLSRRPDAVFLTGVHHSANCRRQLLSARIPIVETWDITPTPLDVVVGFSHDAIGRAVARHFFQKGHTHFGVASAGDPRAIVRANAYTDELTRLGATNIRTVIRGPAASIAIGREILSELLNDLQRPLAVFCSSDTIALGVMFEVQARGLSIPDDIAIMGFGDQTFAAHTHPALSTVRIDCAGIGRQSAEKLLARIEGASAESSVVDVRFEVLVRQTA